MDNLTKRKLDPSTETSAASQDTENAPDKRRKVIGPSLPPPTSSNKDDSDNNSDSGSDSDSDDDFGPSMPPPEGSVASPQVQASIQSTAASMTTTADAEKSAPKRDAWMLAPPSASSDRSRVDPTKLRNRKFQSGPRVGNAPSGGGVDSSWTETPEEKMRRLQDEAMGVVSSSGGSGASRGRESDADAAKAQAMREKVAKYNEQLRGKESGSLVDEKKRADKEQGKDGEKEDDPSKRAFDKEKDMALSSKLTNAQRREMMSKAADFGSRFSKGKFL